MAFIWIDKTDDKDFILADDINGIAKELIRLGKDAAEKNLSNVSNEDFAAKAEEAGIGNAGLTEEKCIMEFMGTVSELPDDAEEGQVYKLDPWKNLGSFSSAQYNVELSNYSFAVNNESGLPDPIVHIDENFVEGTTYKIITPEREYTYANCNGKEWGSVYTTIYGEIEESFEDEFVYLNNDTVTIYEYDANAKSTSFVRFNGEWIELSKDGVTKAEMESYIEETLLGGEW